jgi:hypothetical protein
MIPWNLVYLPFFALFTFGPFYFVVPHFILNFQETNFDHVKAGFLRDGFGATPEMSKQNLI